MMLSLAEGEVHVWFDRPEPADETTGLGPEELRRFARLSAAARRRAIGRRRWVRSVLARYLDCGPEELDLAFGERGKPRLSPIHDLCFNVAHVPGSRGEPGPAVVAVARSEIGVDAEGTGRGRLEGVERSLSAGDVGLMAGVHTDLRPARLRRAWVRKEALMKCSGLGISLRPEQLSVLLEPDEISPPGPPLPFAYDGEGVRLAGVNLYDLPARDDWVGAVALLGDVHSIQVAPWT